MNIDELEHMYVSSELQMYKAQQLHQQRLAAEAQLRRMESISQADSAQAVWDAGLWSAASYGQAGNAVFQLGATQQMAAATTIIVDAFTAEELDLLKGGP